MVLRADNYASWYGRKRGVFISKGNQPKSLKPAEVKSPGLSILYSMADRDFCQRYFDLQIHNDLFHLLSGLNFRFLGIIRLF